MVRLIQLIIWGNWRRWEILDEVALNGREGGRGRRYHLRCPGCGEVVKRDLI